MEVLRPAEVTAHSYIEQDGRNQLAVAVPQYRTTSPAYNAVYIGEYGTQALRPVAYLDLL